VSATYKVNVPAELLRLGYTLLRRLGEGSTAEVFEARHNATGRRLAVKVSRADVPEAPLIVARMQTEWNVGRGLKHPHLVQTLDGGTFSDGRAWLAMELLVGHDLLQELEAHGPLAPARAVHITRQVCEALQVLHRRGAVHRDIKPENVFLSADGAMADHVKVIDLGILALPEDDPERAHEPTGHFILGTPLYLAPEQARGHAPDARTDLYAVGGVLFHMLAGRPPFEGDDPTAIVAHHVNDPVDRLDSLVPDLPPSLVALVHQCLQKQREDRPSSAAEVVSALDRVSDDLAGGFTEDASLRGAPLPPIPPPGHQGEWLRLAENLEHLVGLFWGKQPPGDLGRGLTAVKRARSLLERAQAEAEKRREAADLAARHRIEHRERLQRKQRRISSALARMQARLRDAGGAVEAAADAVAAHDERYFARLAALREQVGETVQTTELEAVLAVQTEVDGLLRERTALTKTLKEARDAERGAAEAVAELKGEEFELQRAFADQELEQEEDGFRNEQVAAAAADMQTNAARGFERAALRLLALYCGAVAGGARRG
jgi:hypothetical protein